MKTRDIVSCGMFTVLIAVGAFIRIPLPMVPFTMQVFFVLLAGSLMGSRLGAVSCIAYMLLGLAGVPIFTEGGGIWYIMKPTFGYIIGFCLGAFVVGLVVEKIGNYKIKTLLFAYVLGLIVIYATGLVYFYCICNFVLHTPIAVVPLFISGFCMTIPGDIISAFLAAVLAGRLHAAMPEGGMEIR